jgi:hypothetical protein
MRKPSSGIFNPEVLHPNQQKQSDMVSSLKANPITQRIDAMVHLWERFREQPEARVCRWVIAPDEKQMVDAFLETSYLEQNPLPDLFLPFYTPFTDSADYARGLMEELRANLENDQKALEEAGIQISWRPAQQKEEEEADAAWFLRNLNRLAEQYPLPEEGYLVAVLLPPVAEKPYGKWLLKAVRAGIPARLRLLVLDQASAETLAVFAAKSPLQVHSTTLDLDMPTAMRQLASVGNPADPGVKFRKAFLNLAQAASAKDLAAVQRLEVLPLAIAREQGWAPMEIAVHGLVASAYIGLNQLPEAVGRYDLGLQLAQKAYATGDKSALTLAVQALSCKGSVHLSQKAYEDAANAFAAAAPLAQEAGDFFQVMEAKRMHGYCLEKSGELAAAFEVEEEGLMAAAKVEESIRQNSTLPYLGQSLLELAYRLGYKDQYAEIEEKMTTLAGPDWPNKLPKAKAAAV